jgi:hypothetical protein
VNSFAVSLFFEYLNIKEASLDQNNCFLNEFLWFLTFLLSDQLIFDRYNHSLISQHKSESPLIKSTKEYQRSLKYQENHDPAAEPNQFFNFNLEAKATRELDKGRGARTTLIKPLSTLIPLVMCFEGSN